MPAKAIKSVLSRTFRSLSQTGFEQVRSDGSAVGDVPGLRQVLANGNLVFPPFRAEDYRQEVHAQVYACLAKNSVGSINSRDVNVRAGQSLVTSANGLFSVFCKNMTKCLLIY